MTDSALKKLCDAFFREVSFTGPLQIGDHRKHFKCLSTVKKVTATVRLLLDYRHAMESHSSQAGFFEIGRQDVSFDLLYTRMKDAMPCFSPRLPRFDHLERLSRTHGFYCTPERFYAEDSTGPLFGLTLVVLGVRLGKDNGTRKADIERDFPKMWDQSVPAEYRILQHARFRIIIANMERWFIDQVRQILPATLKEDKALVFDLESCLCNWQKGGGWHHGSC
jgi:hypothetical protein